MENPQTQLLKEKQINRSYYLKRMLIWQQISSPFSSLILFFVSLFFVTIVVGWKLPKDDELDDGFRKLSLFVLLTFLVLISCLFVFSTYYSTKFWKADKECQELTNSILAKIEIVNKERNLEERFVKSKN